MMKVGSDGRNWSSFDRVTPESLLRDGVKVDRSRVSRNRLKGSAPAGGGWSAAAVPKAAIRAAGRANRWLIPS